jgi:hypothetical protein
MRGETPAVTELEGVVPEASDQLEPEPVKTDTSEQTEPEAPVPVVPPVPLTAEELQVRLAAAEARLEEKDNFIGRQSGEVGELRQAVNDLQAQVTAAQAQPPTQAPAAIQITQELIEESPARAAQAALDQGDQASLERVFEHWKDPVMGDPFAAATWLNDKKLEQQQKAFDERLAATQKQFETATAPLAATAAESAEDRAWVQAFDVVKGQHPDLFAVDPETGQSTAERLIAAAVTVPEYAVYKELLQTGDSSSKAAALSALYALDRLGNPQAVQAQLEQAAQEAAAEAAAAIAGAGVITSQSTAGQGTELKTEEELEQESYLTRQRGKPSLSRGWTGR